jgi:hypothetical protein
MCFECCKFGKRTGKRSGVHSLVGMRATIVNNDPNGFMTEDRYTIVRFSIDHPH